MEDIVTKRCLLDYENRVLGMLCRSTVISRAFDCRSKRSACITSRNDRGVELWLRTRNFRLPKAVMCLFRCYFEKIWLNSRLSTTISLSSVDAIVVQYPVLYGRIIGARQSIAISRSSMSRSMKLCVSCTLHIAATRLEVMFAGSIMMQSN